MLEHCVSVVTFLSTITATAAAAAAAVANTNLFNRLTFPELLNSRLVQVPKPELLGNTAVVLTCDKYSVASCCWLCYAGFRKTRFLKAELWGFLVIGFWAFLGFSDFLFEVSIWEACSLI